MSRTVILVEHPTGGRDDRASALLERWGYRLHWVCPYHGDSLPDPKGEAVAAIVYGGAESANDDREKPYLRTELDWIERWLDTGKPYLGLCLGAQMLARVLGARVRPHPQGHYEIGYVPIRPTPQANGFLHGLERVYHWHTEGFDMPTGAERLAEGEIFPNQAFRYGAAAYGLQFHPEVTRAMMTRWMDSAAHMLDNPNAHPRERQLADAAVHEPAMARWLERFLRAWLARP
ncbi:MAG: glutamine amidotransferase [Alphaproteobacteria bacterium]|nr:MAG: glutamine amidotransferase [Alphaproteobacteria bacterium]